MPCVFPEVDNEVYLTCKFSSGYILNDKVGKTNTISKNRQNLEDKMKATGDKEIKGRKGLWLNKGNILCWSHRSHYLEEVRVGNNTLVGTVLM